MATLNMQARSYGISIKRDEINAYRQNALSDFFLDVGPRLPGIAVWQIKDLQTAQQQYERLSALGLDVKKDW